MRDLRIFRIFEGTNDILRLFVSLTGIQVGDLWLAFSSQNNLQEIAATFSYFMAPRVCWKYLYDYNLQKKKTPWAFDTSDVLCQFSSNHSMLFEKS